MIAYQYKHGDRPLEGYVIERAAGRGGFGEVYYATSDSGREVALKAILGYEQIELRGISQCMNLKSPHLVTIFDVKFNDQGRPFVIMEFVNGPSLRELLDQSPAGLGEQKAAFFLREMAKGLTFLHDCGIVHRDLKPANIFYENGYVKIGDYGLSKAISTNHHSGQTVTVGTVHYMAPEIGAGKYDRSIDIYALGACLYEMLNGTPPFIGASPSEVLMKHLASEPDCSGISEPFRTVIRKAMAKDPLQRYQSVQEMVEAVFGAEHIRQSVSVFSPMGLSMVAQQAARALPRSPTAPAPSPSPGARPHRINEWVDSDVMKVVTGFADRALGNAEAEQKDTLPRKQRAALGLITMIILAVAGGMFASGRIIEPHAAMWFIWLAVAGGVTGTLVISRWLMHGVQREAPMIQRIASGGSSFAVALVVSSLAWGIERFNDLPETWLAIALPLFLMNTYAWASPLRKQRVVFWEDVFLAGLFAWIAAMIFGGNGILAAAVVGGIALVTQVAAPWDPSRIHRASEVSPPPIPRKRPLGTVINGNVEINTLEQPIPPGAVIRGNAVIDAPDGAIAPGTRIEGNAVIRTPDGKLPPQVHVLGNASVQVLPWWRPVTPFSKWVWVSLLILSFTASMMSFVAAGQTYSSRDQGVFLGIGLSCLAGTAIFLIQVLRKRYYGKWSNIFKPLALLLCLSSALISLALLGNSSMGSDEAMAAVFFIVFPLALGTVLLCVSGKRALLPSRAVPPPLPRSVPETDRLEPADRMAATQNWQSGSYSVIGSLPGLARRGVSGLVVLIIFLLMLASVLTGLSVALDVPAMLAAGVLDPSLAQELNEQTFGNYPKWPQLINRITVSVMFILMVTAVIMLLIARRSSGVLHMLRGVVGAGGLLFALLPLAKSTGGQFWPQVADAVHVQQNPALALDLFLSAWPGPILVLSLAIMLASLVLLVWSPTKERSAPSATPMLKEVAV
jgi:hypothetical protein